jgi:hypothetical protein
MSALQQHMAFGKGALGLAQRKYFAAQTNLTSFNWRLRRLHFAP